MATGYRTLPKHLAKYLNNFVLENREAIINNPGYVECDKEWYDVLLESDKPLLITIDGLFSAFGSVADVVASAQYQWAAFTVATFIGISVRYFILSIERNLSSGEPKYSMFVGIVEP